MSLPQPAVSAVVSSASGTVRPSEIRAVLPRWQSVGTWLPVAPSPTITWRSLGSWLAARTTVAFAAAVAPGGSGAAVHRLHTPDWQPVSVWLDEHAAEARVTAPMWQSLAAMVAQGARTAADGAGKERPQERARPYVVQHVYSAKARFAQAQDQPCTIYRLPRTMWRNDLQSLSPSGRTLPGRLAL